MADTKITGLAQQVGGSVDPGVDVFVVVDTSDTTMASSGTDKKITGNDLRIGIGTYGVALLVGQNWFLP